MNTNCNSIIRTLFALLFLIQPYLKTNSAFAQNVGINVLGLSPNTAAILDIDAAPNFNKGLLIPRVTFSQRTTGFNPLSSAAQGLTVYQTDAGGFGEGFYFNTSTSTTPAWSFLLNNTSGWSLTGNAATTPSSSAIGTAIAAGQNYLGTSDLKDFVLATNNLERLRINSAGNIGIGTSTPGTLLDVNGSTRALLYTFPAPTGDPAPVITARTVPSGQGASAEKTELILFHSNDPANAAGADQITLRAPALSFQTFNDVNVLDMNNNVGYNERMYINPIGNVGIGTIAPQTLLHLTRPAGGNGNLIFEGNSSVTGAPKIYFIDITGAAITTAPSWMISNTNDKMSISRALTLGGAYADFMNISNTGNIGIGTNTPSTQLHSTGGVRFQILAGTGTRIVVTDANGNLAAGSSIASGIVTGSGTLNYVPKWTPDGATLGNSIIFDNGTNVGIGTNAPLGKLDVVGDVFSYNTGFGQFSSTAGVKNYANFSSDNHGSVLVGSNLYSNNGTLYIAKTHNSLSGVGVFMPGNGQSRQGGIDFYTKSVASVTADALYSTTPNMVLSSTGNLGVGTTSPISKTQITGDLSITSGLIHLANNYDNGWYGIRLAGEDNGINGHDLKIKGRTTNTGTFSDLVTVKNSGNVGIGTTSPSGKLDVNGDFYIKGVSGINNHYGSYSVGAGIRELFRVSQSALCTGGTFTIFATRGSFVHTTQWAWSSTHNGSGRGVLTQLSSGEYSNIIVYLDVASDGSIIISADWGAAQGYNISIQKTSGAVLDLNNAGTDWSTVNAGYTRVRTVNTISNGFQTVNAAFSGNVGIGTTTPSTQLHSTGGVRFQNLTGTGNRFVITDLNGNISAGAATTAGIIAGSGTLNYVPKWTPDGNTLGNSSIFDNGNVGIGTTNPYSKLSLTSDNETGGFSLFASGYEPGRLWGTRIFKKDCYQGIGNATACNGIPLTIETQYNGTWYSSAMFGAGQDINHPTLRTFGQTYLASNGGNVGIGTTSPGAALSFANIVGEKIRLGDYGGGAIYKIGVASNDLQISTGVIGDYISLNPNGVQTLVARNGSVGIGTSSPAEKLHVSGGNTFLESNSVTGGDALIVQTAADNSGEYTGIRLNVTTGLQYGAVRAYVGPSGLSRLGLLAGDNAGTSLTERLSIISNSGNVGIGTTGPQAKLHVEAGKIYGSKTSFPNPSSYSDADLVLGSNTDTRNGFGGTNGSHIFLRSSDKSTITALDENQDLGQISYQNLVWTIGENVGWGTQTIKLPKLAGTGTRFVVTDLNGNISAGAATTAGIIAGSGTLNYVPKWTPDGNTLGNSSIFDNGNVGIGTTNPYSKLSLTSDNETGGFSLFASGYEPGRLWGTRIFKKDCYQGIGNATACNGIPLTIETQYNGTWYSSAMFGAGQDINHPTLRTFGQTYLASNGGNVSVGNTAPLFKLQVSGAANAGDGTFLLTGGGTSASFYDAYVDGTSAYYHTPGMMVRKDNSATRIDQAPVALTLYNNDGTDNTWTKLSLANREGAGAGNPVSIAGIAAQKTSGTVNAWASGDLVLWAKSSGSQVEVLRAKSNGNVGIGTTAPVQKLEVAGSVKVNNSIWAGGYYATGAGNINSYAMEVGGPTNNNSGSQASIFFHHHGIIAHQLRYNSGTLYWEAAGNGYGTNTTPVFQVGGSTFLAVNGGNVGVGTTAPLRALHVNGEFSISRSDKVGFINISDINGNGGGTLWLRGLAAGGSAGTDATIILQGTVGVGTTSPGTGGAKLEVAGVARSQKIIWSGGSTSHGTNAGWNTYRNDGQSSFSNAQSLGYITANGAGVFTFNVAGFYTIHFWAIQLGDGSGDTDWYKNGGRILYNHHSSHTTNGGCSQWTDVAITQMFYFTAGDTFYINVYNPGCYAYHAWNACECWHSRIQIIFEGSM